MDEEEEPEGAAGRGPDDQSVRLYTSREDRRESGPSHEIGETLSYSMFLEYEWLEDEFDPVEGPDTRLTEVARAFELEVEYTPVDWLTIEAVYEYR